MVLSYTATKSIKAHIVFRFSLIIIVRIENIARQLNRKEAAIKVVSLQLIVESIAFSMLNHGFNVVLNS